MTGSGPPWRKARPLAAPSAILIRLDQGRGMVPSIVQTNCINKNSEKIIIKLLTIKQENSVKITSEKENGVVKKHKVFILDGQYCKKKSAKLTSEKMIFKASTHHKLIHKQPLIILTAVSN